MSLETAITEHTAAIRELIAAISKGAPVAASTVAQVATAADTANADAKKPGAEAKEFAAPASSPSGAAPQTTAQEASAPADKALTYDDIKTPFLQLIKDKGRDAAANLLKPFGAAKLPDVKPEDFGRVLEAIRAAQGEEALA